MADRTVHASYDGMEIVRYDRSGHWYLEPTDYRLKRQKVSLHGALLSAKWAHENGGQVFIGRPGGAQFDAGFRAWVRGE